MKLPVRLLRLLLSFLGGPLLDLARLKLQKWRDKQNL